MNVNFAFALMVVGVAWAVPVSIFAYELHELESHRRDPQKEE